MRRWRRPRARAASTCWCSIPLDGSSQHRREPLGRQHLLGAARAARGVDLARREEAIFLQRGVEQVAAGYAIYGPSTMLVISVGNGIACLHAGALHRRVHAHASRAAHPRAHLGVRHQQLQQPLLGAADRALRLGCLAGAAGPRGTRLQHALDRLPRGRGPPRAHARRRVPLPARQQATPRSPGGCGCSTRPTPSASSWSRRAGARASGARRCSRRAPDRLHQRIGLVFGSRERGRAHRALPRRADAGDAGKDRRSSQSAASSATCAPPL